MRGERLIVANKVALKTYRKYEKCSPWTWVKSHPFEAAIISNLEEFLSHGVTPYRKTKVFCSGPCCGNPRKFFNEVPIQERKQLLQLEDYYREKE